MKTHILRILSAILISMPLMAQAAITVSADKDGHWGASDGNGTIIVPLQYDFAELVADDFIVVGKTSKEDPQGVYGVFNAQGKQIIQTKYLTIDYDKDFKRFKVMVNAGEARFNKGYLDENGKEVIPAVYDSLERISNNGDEPTNIAKRDGKYGYINIVSGKVMIPVEYDALDIDSLKTSIDGRGVAIARKGEKFGVLSTDGEVLLPFDFDAIGDITLTHGAPAERDGKLVQLEKVGYAKGFTVNQDVVTEYSSNFVPRLTATVNSQPFDGLYVAEDYQTMKSVWDACKAGALTRLAIPSIQINGKRAYVAFDVFAQSPLHKLDDTLLVAQKPNGFALIGYFLDPNTNKPRPKEFLTFKQENGSMVCDKCQGFNIPVRWRLLPSEKPQKISGIGIVLIKRFEDDPGAKMLGVLPNSPADKAGLEDYDVITEIDGHYVGGLNMDQTRDMLRGKVGSSVRLKVTRYGRYSAKTIVVARTVITVFPNVGMSLDKVF